MDKYGVVKSGWIRGRGGIGEVNGLGVGAFESYPHGNLHGPILSI